jgi:hypothetical protein
MPRPKRRFSPADIWFAAELYQMGASLTNIARRMGRYPSRIADALVYAGRYVAAGKGARVDLKPIASEPSEVANVRPCMCCGLHFPSEGKHNRMCAQCRAEASQVEPHVVGGRTASGVRRG